MTKNSSQQSALSRHKPVPHRRLTDIAHEAIRAAIIAGDFKMGERLIESRIATELEMSRAPVREALRRLVEEGLVTDHAHHGTSVASLAAEDIADLYNVRLGLETVGLRGYMRNGGSTGPLAGLIARMEKAADRGDRSAVVSAEFDFHRHIAEGSGNALLAKVFGDLEGRLTIVLALDDESFADLHEVAAEHEPVVDAIDSGDEVAAVEVFEDHLVSTVGQLLARIQGDPDAVMPPLHTLR